MVQQIIQRLSNIQLRPINNFVDVAEACDKLLFASELINEVLNIWSATPGLYAESASSVVVAAGSNPIPRLSLTPPAGTYFVTLSVRAVGVGVTNPGVAVAVAGTIVPSSERPMAASGQSRCNTQAVVTVDGNTAIDGYSVGTGTPTTYDQRSLAAVRVKL